MRLPRRQALLWLAALPAACSTSPAPSLYTLAVIPGPTHLRAPRRIELRAISLAHYLERSQIVRSTEGFRLDVLGNDWWGEPLDSMLSRVLVRELSQRLPGSTVFPENGAITITADVSVEVNVQRLDLDQAGRLVLDAQVALTGHADAARDIRIAEQPPSGDTTGLVSAMSVAVSKLADAMAEMLAR